jgi:hypothetical protein
MYISMTYQADWWRRLVKRPLSFSFETSPCTPDLDDPAFDEYELAWRRGTLALYESIMAARYLKAMRIVELAAL